MQGEKQADEEEIPDTDGSQYEEYPGLLNTIISGYGEQLNTDEFLAEDWSAGEKDRFFAALCSHSALRPDLIAEVIGTKNVAQVCIYLSALEDAAKTCDAEPLRSKLDIAMEVSDQWLDAEEEQAEFLRDIKLALGENIGSQQQAISEPAPERADLEVDSVNMRRNALKNLSIDHLKVIDKILRNEKVLPEISSSPALEAEHEQTVALSPTERRRLQKRLHMRRKRAEISGTDVVTDAQRLQRGRKRKTARSSSRAPNHSGGDGPNSESEEGQRSEDGDRPKKRPRKRGFTREQKILETFTELGIDAAVCRDQELDLFHFQPLGQLIALYQEQSSTSEATITAISLDTVLLFRAVIANFVTQVIHRSIMLREQEILLKGRRNVWGRENDEIYPDTIESAVTMLGYPTTKAKACEHLYGEDDCSGDDGHTAEEIDVSVVEVGINEPNNSVNDDSPTSSEGSPLLSRLEMNLPLVRLPLHCSVPSESLMPLETDEESLDEELAEEEKLDQQDQALEKMHQDEMWAAHKLNTARLLQS
ncbi:hypothetical protein J3R30DRAFT_3456587 [Lentinula aciculospora]|uniref:Uncharacterized protein n=1 Tax=Lentinula aciculospora TaxID=153920 RepID=A0A9W9AGE6_9AGAR|nr:hypothetical protein J3R30DRAFT_3456587 [Lentinula aciculospora]